jgi:hypothetical protein|tara:strand:+ start:544 stop:1077 length:534 start_codon:yes stop_codon:yes gene_type:complete
MTYGHISFVANKICNEFDMTLQDVLHKRSKKHQIVRSFVSFYGLMHTDLNYKNLNIELGNNFTEGTVRRQEKAGKKLYREYFRLKYFNWYTSSMLHLDWFFKSEAAKYYEKEMKLGRGVLPPKYPYNDEPIGIINDSGETIVTSYKRNKVKSTYPSGLGVHKRTASRRYLEQIKLKK